MLGHDPSHTGRSSVRGPTNPTLRRRFRIPPIQYITYNYHGSPPVIGPDGTIYVGSDPGYLFAVWPDGTERWRVPTSAPFYQAPAVAADGTVYVNDWESILAFDRTRWGQEASRSSPAEPLGSS